MCSPEGNRGWRRLGLSGRVCLAGLLALALSTVGLTDDRTQLQPGFNLFSPQQDIQLGQQAAAQVPKQFSLLNDRRVDEYLQKLGLRLAARAPGYRYPYQYRCINSMQINAFALPGGFIYINRGAIQAADDEAQLAAVMAHETSHVALRHGTSQATKAAIAQDGLSLLGALVGGSTAASLMAQVLGGVGIPLAFLKMSRTDERQADILGTQILHDAGYDPRAMAQFFEKLEKQSKSQPVEFFSDHPSPVDRVQRVEEEIGRLGGPPPHAREDSREFEGIKRYVKSLPPAPLPAKAGGAAPSAGISGPGLPSSGAATYSNGQFALRHPDNWKVYGQGGKVTLAPDGGIVKDSRGNSALAYGASVSVFPPRRDSAGRVSLLEATDQLIQSLERSHPRMNVLRRPEPTRLGGQPALSTYLQSVSPAGGREADWLVTTLRPGGLLCVVCVSPQRSYKDYDAAFRALVDSVRFPS